MAGIAGMARQDKAVEVRRMLDKMAHRGGRCEIMELEEATLGVTSTGHQTSSFMQPQRTVRDYLGNGHFAQAQVLDGHLILLRDPTGVAPLYYGRDRDGVLCFASEVKALLEFSDHVAELPPGYCYDGAAMSPYFRLHPQKPLIGPPEPIAQELRRRLEAAVREAIPQGAAGAWLSGGLDSSVIAALVRPSVKQLHTFVAGLSGAPDIGFARDVATFVKTEHHEVIVAFGEMLRALPDVIYHLESFDALLVRSSIMHYLAAKAAAEYVPAVFSGEGGDELFAGYEYLKALDPARLASELLDITGRLHNTALQRVDRCASAHGLAAQVPFLDPQVVDYALRIPVEYKLCNGVEKWILRQSMAGALPDGVLNRRKAKFWEGAGVGEQLAAYAEQHVSDDDFRRERALPNGWTLNTKEELMYYRLFAERFGRTINLDWMGRTKGAPRQ